MSAAYCRIIIAGIPIMNFGFFVLCLISSITVSIAALPPSAERRRSVFSGTRRRPFILELCLSAMHTTADISEIIAMYDIRI